MYLYVPSQISSRTRKYYYQFIIIPQHKTTYVSGNALWYIGWRHWRFCVLKTFYDNLNNAIICRACLAWRNWINLSSGYAPCLKALSALARTMRLSYNSIATLLKTTFPKKTEKEMKSRKTCQLPKSIWWKTWHNYGCNKKSKIWRYVTLRWFLSKSSLNPWGSKYLPTVMETKSFLSRIFGWGEI